MFIGNNKESTEYRASVQTVVRDSTCGTYHFWCPLDQGWIKVNFDAHMGMNDQGFGAVIRDANGVPCTAGYWSSQSTTSVESVDVTEAMAAKFVIDLALRLGYNRIHLEGDAHTMIASLAKGAVGFFAYFFSLAVFQLLIMLLI